MNFKKILTNKITRNAGWIVGGRIIQMLINLVVGVLTTRYLGPSNFGIINYAGAYTAFFMSLCTLGINSVIVKEFVDNPGEEGKILGTSIGLKALSSFTSALMIIGIVSIVDKNDPTVIVVVALCSVGPIFNTLETFNYWFQSRMRSKITAISLLIGYVITSAYRVVLLVLNADVKWFALATSIDYVAVGIMLILFYKKENGGKLSFSFNYGKSILRKSAPFILPSLMVSIYGQTDKLMLKQMISDAEIGYYATAVSVCSMWCFVLTAIIDSFYPSIMELHKTDEIEFQQKNILLYRIVFYISVFVSVVLTVCAELVIRILYGIEFLPAAEPLKVITWYTAFSYLGVARNAWIVCKNRQKYLIFIYVSAAIANVILNILFIPTMGSVGAAIASLMAQVITTMVVPFFIKPLRENSIMMLKGILFINSCHLKKSNENSME